MSSSSRTGLGRRHYRLLAGALHDAGVDIRDPVLNAVIAALARDNPRFDRRRFHQWVSTGDDGTARRYP